MMSLLKKQGSILTTLLTKALLQKNKNKNKGGRIYQKFLSQISEFWVC